MHTFHINLYCPNAYHRHYHLICAPEQHTKNNPKSNSFTKTQTQGSFRFVTLISVISCQNKEFFLCVVILLYIVSKLQKPPAPGLDPRTDL
jgi:hypothetical protein